MTKTKEEGGLRLQSTNGRNIALLPKLNWRFHIEREAPWVQVLKMSYSSHRRRIASNANKLPCSPIWVAIKRGMDTFNRGSKWMMGKDSKLNVWSSNWTMESPLRQLIQGPFIEEAGILEIKDIMSDMGWDWEKIPFELPQEIKMMIQATPTALTSRGSDRLSWEDSPKGTFDLKSAYKIAIGIKDTSPFSAKWIWKADTLPRIKTFL